MIYFQHLIARNLLFLVFKWEPNINVGYSSTLEAVFPLRIAIVSYKTKQKGGKRISENLFVVEEYDKSYLLILHELLASVCLYY